VDESRLHPNNVVRRCLSRMQALPIRSIQAREPTTQSNGVDASSGRECLLQIELDPRPLFLSIGGARQGRTSAGAVRTRAAGAPSEDLTVAFFRWQVFARIPTPSGGSRVISLDSVFGDVGYT
jgi:hypothetical protein